MSIAASTLSCGSQLAAAQWARLSSKERLNQDLRRVIAEWPQTAGADRQPRLRELVEELNNQGITSRTGRPWKEQMLHSYMVYNNISINEILPDHRAWARTQADNERIRREEQESGIERNNQSWCRAATPSVRSSRLIAIETTLRRVNQFFSIRRKLGPLMGLEASVLPLPGRNEYETFPFEEVCIFLNATGDRGPTDVAWQPQNLRRFLDRSWIHRDKLLQRYSTNVSTFMGSLTISPEEDVVIVDSEIHIALGRATGRMETVPLVPVTLDADGAR